MPPLALANNHPTPHHPRHLRPPMPWAGGYFTARLSQSATNCPRPGQDRRRITKPLGVTKQHSRQFYARKDHPVPSQERAHRTSHSGQTRPKGLANCRFARLSLTRRSGVVRFHLTPSPLGRVCCLRGRPRVGNVSQKPFLHPSCALRSPGIALSRALFALTPNWSCRLLT